MAKVIKKTKNPINKIVEVHYIKNGMFRQIHVDGLIGGVTPTAHINLNFYAERLAIPKAETTEIKENGFGDIVERSPNSKNGVIREIEFGIYLDIRTAESIKRFLEIKLEEIKNMSIVNNKTNETK